MRLVWLACLCPFVAAPAFAADCAEARDQASLTRCHGDRAKAAAGRLSAVASRYRKGLSGEALRRFDAAQAAWAAFRDLDCRFRGSGTEGGSAHSMVLSICLEEHTLRRLQQVEALAKCEEGDLSCPARE